MDHLVAAMQDLVRDLMYGRDRLIIYGGNTAASERCGVPPSEIVAEMWAFHFDCGSWEQLTPAGGPGALARHAVVADTANDRMLVFGGRASSSSYSNALWAFDLTTDTWSELAPSGTAPPVGPRRGGGNAGVRRQRSGRGARDP